MKVPRLPVFCSLGQRFWQAGRSGPHSREELEHVSLPHPPNGDSQARNEVAPLEPPAPGKAGILGWEDGAGWLAVVSLPLVQGSCGPLGSSPTRGRAPALPEQDKALLSCRFSAHA